MTAPSTTPMLPVECMTCHRVYRNIPAGHPLLPGEHSSGWCPECLPAVHVRLFGDTRYLDHSPTLAEVNARRGFDVEDLR